MLANGVRRAVLDLSRGISGRRAVVLRRLQLLDLALRRKKFPVPRRTADAAWRCRRRRLIVLHDTASMGAIGIAHKDPLSRRAPVRLGVARLVLLVRHRGVWGRSVVGRFGNVTKFLFHPRPERPTEPNGGFLKYEPGASFPLHRHDFAPCTFRADDKQRARRRGLWGICSVPRHAELRSRSALP